MSHSLCKMWLVTRVSLKENNVLRYSRGNLSLLLIRILLGILWLYKKSEKRLCSS